MTVRPHPTHAPSLPPRVCPGGLVVRLVSDKFDRLILEHPLPAELSDQGVLDAVDHDYDRAMHWLQGHPDDVIFAYVYNGDSGLCDGLVYLTVSDVRADENGKQRVPIVRLNQCVPALLTPATDPLPMLTPETRAFPVVGRR